MKTIRNICLSGAVVCFGLLIYSPSFILENWFVIFFNIATLGSLLSVGAVWLKKTDFYESRGFKQSMRDMLIWFYNLFFCGYILAYILLDELDILPKDFFDWKILCLSFVLGSVWSSFIVWPYIGRIFSKRKKSKI